MKFLAYILTIVILICAFNPCAEGRTDDCNTQKPISDIDNQSDHKETESCSPLCVCSCCGVFSNTISFSVSFKPLSESISPFKCTYKEPQLKDFPNFIWQPPKLS